MTPEALNATVVLVILAVCALFCIARFFTGTPSFLNPTRNPAVCWAFGFWAASWFTVFCVYAFLRETSVHRHLLLVLLDLGDLCLLASAIAYMSGNARFKLRRLVPLPLVALLYVLFYFFVPAQIIAKNGPALAVVTTAPSIVLANVAVLGLGWAFFARWGLTAGPYLLVASIYSVAQLPAYLFVFVGEAHDVAEFQSLRFVLLGLAVGKLVLAVYPLAFFVSTVSLGNGFEREGYWPAWGLRARLEPGVGRGLLYAGHLFGVTFGGFFVKRVGRLLARLLFGIEIE